MTDACRRYHDHVAPIYDDIYSRSPYWEFYHELSWDYMLPYLPRDLSAPVHDAGCGTGRYGLKLLQAGFKVLFSDISARMLDVARRKVEQARFADRAEFLQLDLCDLSALEDGRFALVCGQGDPLSLCADPQAALREIARTLAPGGVAVLSVDNRAAGYDYFFEKEDLEGLKAFHRSGVLTWLAASAAERFPFFTFDPRHLEQMAGAAGLTVESVAAKGVLPVRQHPGLLARGSAFRAILKIEKSLGGKECYFGRASHLQTVLRRP